MKRLCWLIVGATVLAAGCPPPPPVPRDPGRRGRSGAQTKADEAQRLAKMRAHFINVGQGDAVLLEFPCGAVLVQAHGRHVVVSFPRVRYLTQSEFDAVSELHYTRRQHESIRETPALSVNESSAGK